MNKISLNDIKDFFIIGFFTSLFLGIIVFSAYFINIKYFPMSNLSSIIYLPVIVGLTGFTLFAALVGAIGLAPYFWTELLKSRDTCSLIVGAENTKSVMQNYAAGLIDLNIKNRMRVFLWYVGTMLFCMGLWFIANVLETKTFFIFLLVLGFIGKHWVLLTQKKSSYFLDDSQRKTKTVVCLTLAKIICFSLLSSLFLFIIYLGLVSLIELKDIVIVVLLALVITFASSICLLPFSNKWKLLNWTLLVSAMSIISFIIIFGILTSISSKIMLLFKFGHMKNTSLIVDEVGCNIFKANGFAISCPEAQKQYQINGVNILWRVNEYYVQNANQKTVGFTFSDKHILSVKTS